jgi:predicted TPR repeat methyltransferase
MVDSSKSPAQQWEVLKEAARDMFVTRPMLYLQGLRGRLGNLPQTNFDMGCSFVARGAMRDAAMRFRIAVKLNPDFAQAWHNLGTCLLQLGDVEKAAEAFRQVLRLRPADEEALYMLATANPAALGRTAPPTRMPRSMVARFFAPMAPYYAAMEAQNQYAGPAICEQKLMPHIANATGLTVVDLGCGVGLASMPWRQRAARIIGIDMLAEMAREARAAITSGKTLFDAVHEADLYQADALSIPKGEADIALLCNVAQFLGDLQPVMRSVAAWLKPGGLVAITVEPAHGQVLYGINPTTGRFGHSATYLQEIAKSQGFSVLLQERVHLYPAIHAGIVILRKNP